MNDPKVLLADVDPSIAPFLEPLLFGFETGVTELVVPDMMDTLAGLPEDAIRQVAGSALIVAAHHIALAAELERILKSLDPSKP